MTAAMGTYADAAGDGGQANEIVAIPDLLSMLERPAKCGRAASGTR